MVVKSTVSVLHWDPDVGMNSPVTEFPTVCSSVPHFLYTDVKVFPQSLVTNTCSVSVGEPSLRLAAATSKERATESILE